MNRFAKFNVYSNQAFVSHKNFEWEMRGKLD